MGQHKRYQKVQSRLIRELEKKFNRKKPGQMRPRTRTLTAVHSSILDDIVYPTNIVGKRIRVRTDNTKLLKVYLDPKDVKEVDYKLKTFASVYKKLTNKNVEFMFPAADN